MFARVHFSRLVSPLALSAALAIGASACGPLHVGPVSYLTRERDAPTLARRSLDCGIDRYDADRDVPTHTDLAEIETTCDDLRDREQHCWRAVQQQACMLGASLVHHTHERLAGQTLTITTVAAIARD